MARWNTGTVELEPGRFFKESGDDLVEVLPKTVKVTVGKETREVIENAVYEDNLGAYQLTKIDDDGKVDVVYVSVIPGKMVNVGQWKTYPVGHVANSEPFRTPEEKARRQAEKEAQEAMQEAQESFEKRVAKLRGYTLGEAQMFTLGYVTARATIVVHCNEKDADRFAADYEAVTGEAPAWPTKNDHANWQIRPCYWFTGLGITGLGTQGEVPTELILENVCTCQNGAVESWKSKFVWTLFRAGLRIGKNDGRMEEVASKLSPAAQAKFWEGVEAARGN